MPDRENPYERRHWLRRLAQAEQPGFALLSSALVLGLLVGGLAGVFRLILYAANDARRELVMAAVALPIPVWLTSGLISACCVTVAVWLVRRFAPEAAGSGIQEVEGALDGVRPLLWRRVIPVKFFAGILAIGSGMIAGREGPTVQMGGALGQMLGERSSASVAHARTLVAAGAGAGLTAAFNAPFAGILFVLEEMRPRFSNRNISTQALALACISADMVVRVMLGGAPEISMKVAESPPVSSLWLFLLLGSLFGVLGKFFNAAVELWLDAVERFPAPLVAGALIGAAVGALDAIDPLLSGSGHIVTESALQGHIQSSSVLPYFLFWFVGTVVCFGAGSPGGVFAPMLALGTLLGNGFGYFSSEWFPGVVPDPDVFAVVGMGALFAAVVRAPLTGIALAAGLTSNYQLIWPLLATSVAASIVSYQLGGQPLYSRLLERTLVRAKNEIEMGGEGETNQESE
jgi:CIC family chloride channel protein